MEKFTDSQFWMVLIAIAIAAVTFGVGRLNVGSSDRKQKQHTEIETIDMAIAALVLSKREEIERLLSYKQKIAAIKVMRATSGLGLRQAKLAVERINTQG